VSVKVIVKVRCTGVFFRCYFVARADHPLRALRPPFEMFRRARAIRANF